MNEEVLMTLVVDSGNARSLALEAIHEAREGRIDEAEAKLKEADEGLLKAHNVQTDLIQQELNGGGVDINLMTVHAQDHLMCAMVVIDLAREMIEILKTK